MNALPSGVASASDLTEDAVWNDALKTLSTVGLKDALGKLFIASSSAPSIRGQNRYRLLLAKLCLKAERPDLARPIIEQLQSLIEELNLERWESPVWIAEVLDAYYQCLTSGDASDDDFYKANNELFQRICTNDITKAINRKT